ncbi:MAG TPA: translation initiation factor 2 [Thermoanaerobaculia bacterium]|nr:translation initiation factor 2 [Thermoanaerobaculia bacterium]
MKRGAALVVLFSIGCASIAHQTTQQVPVTSSPAGAAVTVACGDVNNDPKLVTPTVVTVHRKPARCTISLAKEGYEPAHVDLQRQMSGWYLGNVIFGGIIGLIVDAANGAMYNRMPNRIDVPLAPATSAPQP